MGALALIRFFRVVPPVPPLIVGLFAVTVSVAGAAILVDSTHASDALVLICVLQVFAASSGFVVPARRGYYDLLFTRVESRTRIVLMHWAASVAPGATGWLTLALVEMLVTSNVHTATLSSGSLAAMWLVSSIPWATTVALPRFAGALGWLVVLAASVLLQPASPNTLLRVLRDPDPLPLSALAFLVYPTGLVGQHLAGRQWITVVPGMSIATMCVVGACAWLARCDIRLEAAQ